MCQLRNLSEISSHQSRGHQSRHFFIQFCVFGRYGYGQKTRYPNIHEKPLEKASYGSHKNNGRSSPSVVLTSAILRLRQFLPSQFSVSQPFQFHSHHWARQRTMNKLSTSCFQKSRIFQFFQEKPGSEKLTLAMRHA